MIAPLSITTQRATPKPGLAAPLTAPGFSTYLDLLRGLAAIDVFVCHYSVSGWLGEDVPKIFNTAHAAVILFFVLSGYVICHLATEREKTGIGFAVNRCARIYSIVVPALLLTIAVDLLLLHIGKPFVSTTGEWIQIPIYQYTHFWKYLPFVLAFGSDFWFLRETAFSDGPLWSLSYEAWYYVIFGLVWYGSGKSRWVGAALVLLLIGPRHWLLMPVWLSGCVVYWLHRRIALSVSAARLLFGASAVAVVALVFADPSHRTQGLGFDDEILHALRFSAGFGFDNLLGPLFAANLFAARYARLSFGAMKAPIAVFASWTFAIYAMHWPLAEFLVGYCSLSGAWLMGISVVAICLLAFLCEQQKHYWRALFLGVSDVIAWIVTAPRDGARALIFNKS